MPRPDLRTSPEAVVNILRAADPWCTAHADVLSELIAPDLLSDHSAHADALEAAHTQYEKEKRDGVDLTTARDAHLDAVRSFLTSLIARIRLTHSLNPKGTAKGLRTTLRRFIQKAPSHVRSLADAQRVMNFVVAALSLKTAQKSVGRTAATLAKKATDIKNQVEALQADAARESQESSQAASNFETQRKTCVKRIASLQLAAEAALIDDATPLSALRAIYDAHNPAPRASSTADDLLESDSDLDDLSNDDDETASDDDETASDDDETAPDTEETPALT